MAEPKILFVDDDPNILAGFQRTLRKQFAFDMAAGGVEALDLLRTDGPYAVVVADMRMPGMEGIELLERVRGLAPDTVRIMLTGNADQQTAVDAVNRGHVFRFLTKPCAPETLVPALETGLKHYELVRVERELLEGTLAGSVKVLAEVLGLVAPDALGRGQRLRGLMHRFAHMAGAGPLWELEIAALLAPLGFASVPPLVLRKLATMTELNPVERTIIQRVPQVGHDLLAGIPRLQEIARIVRYQNQHFDGSGFPGDGCETPIGSRLLKILLDRMDLELDGVVKQRAHTTMRERAGHYDPKLLELSFTCFPDFLDQTVTADLPVRTLPVESLVPGQIVVSDVVTQQGLPLVGAGTRLTSTMLERMRNHALIGDVKGPVFVQDPTT
ncbi:MAG: HD domain-containing phosphohydrolase [Opitutaceae bacterium]